MSLDIGGPEGDRAAEDDAIHSLDDEHTIDYITNKPVKLKGKEVVRQRIARALFHEYGISVDDMARDFPIPIQLEGTRRGTKRADIAIFAPETDHRLENLQRVVICKPEPPQGRSATKLRTFDQARQEMEELETLLGTETTPQVKYGLWTNGLDFFFREKKSGKFGATFDDRIDWPLADDSVKSGSVASAARLRRGEREMLKTAFRRCHNYIHGNEGMPKDAAFRQFLYLLFTKMHDEQSSRRDHRPPEFYVLPKEPFTEEGRQAIQDRILRLFSEVKKEYPLFDDSDVVQLSPRALAFIVGELATYDLSATDMDAKGIAYQELVGTNLRGDRGQYFTPSGAVELMVQILNPQEGERVLDPACGTGGFLREAARHQLNRWRAEEGTLGSPDTEEQVLAHQQRLGEYTEQCVFGADFDQFLVRATKMGLMASTGRAGNIFHMDSLAFPGGHYPDAGEALQHIPLPSRKDLEVDVVMTNPPFGTDIKIEDQEILRPFQDGVAQSWTRNKETGELEAGDKPLSSASPEQLFIQRAVEWVRPGGRVGIVLPNGILSNPGPNDQAIRQWILDHCWVLASVELPVETFIVEANVNILTSLLFLKKKTPQEKKASIMRSEVEDYPVFMAVAEKVGVDRRGKVVYKRRPDGSPIVEDVTEKERLRIGGKEVERTLVRKQKVVDNDLPEIAAAYHRFREQYPEPGAAQ
ncbi:methylation-associated defense system DNA methyltransferase MAD2 [Streptomonospora alba]|uniref:methylation-associated defense system DNA methyltransferase MAD2 n=1 Tax=Streptomonospora alba TaxID=183763 RepID=UPI001930E454|nr:N-6 DNA methylase [Streptomonospora alba]